MPAVERSRHVIALATIEGILMYFIVFPIKICIVCSIKLSLERPVDILISLSCTKLFFFQLCYCVEEEVVRGGACAPCVCSSPRLLGEGALRVPE